LADSQFNSAFPNIKVKLKEQLIKALGKEQFDKTDRKLKEQLSDTLGEQINNKEIAQNFLLQVKARSKGNIDSPVIENLLIVKYLSHPINEFYDGYRNRFNSKGHSKSQGLEIVVKLPKSWKAKEGERPHIVQKWISQNGNGLDMMLLDIRDAQGYEPKDKEIEDFVSSGEVKDSIQKGAIYLDSGIFSLEMRKGYWMEMTIEQDRAGIKLYQHGIMNQVFFRGKAIGIMCLSMSSMKERNSADEKFKKLRPLCQQVLNSLVLLQAY